MDNLLIAESITVGYDAPLHHPIGFTLARHDLLVLRGENGSGKSSLIAALAGTANVLGGRITRLAQTRISLHAQHPIRPEIIPLTTNEYAQLFGCRMPLPARLAAFKNRPIQQLSHGQMQLLSIWCALASLADIVILDEPSNHLDDESLHLMITWLNERHSHQGIMVISHDPILIELATCCVDVVRV